MCGIAGFTHLRTKADRDAIARATQSIRHRGPDQQGTYVSANVSLGAVRLKILDLTGGDQPMRHGGMAIVFNGEIYNFAAVRKELEDAGHRFGSSGDTEVVLRAWIEWGNDCFSRLNGMFAVALWDEAEQRLVLGRDRLGIKPLYIHRRGDDIHFGSELKAIFEHPAVKREIDPVALSHFLSLNYIPRPRTLAAGIEKLDPGTWLEWKRGKVRTERYWKLEFAPDDRIGLEDAKQELDGLLDRSVREHLISDVPLGVWLSGGLDSSTITHYATRHFAGKLKTFSVSFRGRSFDESPYFREVARAFETDHHELDLAPDLDLPAAVERMAWHADEPTADAGALPVWFLSEMTRRQVTVALSGEGADELFGGYVTYTADRYAAKLRKVPEWWRKIALAGARKLPVSDDKISFEYKAKRFLEGAMMDPVAAHLFWNGSCSPGQKRALLGGTGLHEPADLFRELPDVGETNRFIYLDHLLYLSEDILVKCDRMSMAHSLEVRPPFLDHRIAEFAARLPERLKVNGSSLKFVLRELMRERLPRPVLTRKKEGFDIPAHDWFRTKLKPMLLDVVNERAVRASALQWPAVKQLMDDHFARRINAGYQLWGLLNLFLWMKKWNAATN